MGTVFYNYPKEKSAFINPEDVTKRNADFPERCVSTFSENIINKFASLDGVEVIDYLYTANGRTPVYQFIYRDTPIAFYLSRVGAPACAAGLEEVIAMGAKKILLFGSCGILNRAADDKIIIPVSAVRDEGTRSSYQRLPSEPFHFPSSDPAVSEKNSGDNTFPSPHHTAMQNHRKSFPSYSALFRLLHPSKCNNLCKDYLLIFCSPRTSGAHRWYG